jgi:hypothetical protein
MSRLAHLSRYSQRSRLHRRSCVICFAGTTASGILGNSLELVSKHHAKRPVARQTRIDELMELVHQGSA